MEAVTWSDTLDAAGIDTASLHLDSKGTLAPSSEPARVPLQRSLPTLATTDSPERAADVRLFELIGTGGMGRVFAAEQVSLARPVAVKMLRPEVHHAEALLREALVTGRLQHPGIVPVHQLGRSDDGSPILVMKRIVGVSWDAALRSPALVAELAPGREDQGQLVLPGGQSGHPMSPFYRADHEAWLAGTPVAFLPGEARHRLVLKP